MPTPRTIGLTVKSRFQRAILLAGGFLWLGHTAWAAGPPVAKNYRVNASSFEAEFGAGSAASARRVVDVAAQTWLHLGNFQTVLTDIGTTSATQCASPADTSIVVGENYCAPDNPSCALWIGKFDTTANPCFAIRLALPSQSFTLWFPNSSTTTDFQAAIAHEFGHYFQGHQTDPHCIMYTYTDFQNPQRRDPCASEIAGSSTMLTNTYHWAGRFGSPSPPTFGTHNFSVTPSYGRGFHDSLRGNDLAGVEEHGV